MSTGKSRTSEVDGVTPAVGGSKVEVGERHDGFCDLLATDIARA